MKQIGLGIAQYEQDSDERTPCGYKTSGGGCGWAGQIFPYVKSEKVFVCPDDPAKNPVCSYAINWNFAPLVNNVAGTQNGIQLSVMTQPSRTVLLSEVSNSGQNLSYTITYEQQLQMQGLALSNIYPQGHASPSGDGMGQGYDPYGADGGMADSDVAASVSAGKTFMQYATGIPPNGYQSASCPGTCRFASAAGIHQGGACYLMADNHAKWLPPSQVSPGRTYTTYDVCGSASNQIAASFNCTNQTFVATYSYQ